MSCETNLKAERSGKGRGETSSKGGRFPCQGRPTTVSKPVRISQHSRQGTIRVGYPVFPDVTQPRRVTCRTKIRQAVPRTYGHLPHAEFFVGEVVLEIANRQLKSSKQVEYEKLPPGLDDMRN